MRYPKTALYIASPSSLVTLVMILCERANPFLRDPVAMNVIRAGGSGFPGRHNKFGLSRSRSKAGRSRLFPWKSSKDSHGGI
jgi:hypothetical protein